MKCPLAKLDENFFVCSLRMPGHVHAHRNVVLDWHRQERGGVDFEIRECGRNCPRDVCLAALCLQFERNLHVLGSLASELNLQIDVNGRRCGGRFGQAGAHGDHGKLRAPRDLEHMKVAIAVSGIKRLDGYRDQEIALPGVTDSLASRRAAHTLSLMQRVGHMVGDSAVFKDPLAIGSSKRAACHEQEGNQYFLVHKLCLKLKRYRQKSSPKRARRHDCHRSMRGGDAVNLFAVVFLIKSHNSQDGR